MKDMAESGLLQGIADAGCELTPEAASALVKVIRQ